MRAGSSPSERVERENFHCSAHGSTYVGLRHLQARCRVRPARILPRWAHDYKDFGTKAGRGGKGSVRRHDCAAVGDRGLSRSTVSGHGCRKLTRGACRGFVAIASNHAPLRNLNPATDRRRITPTWIVGSAINTRSALRMPAIGRNGCGIGRAALIGGDGSGRA